MQICGETPGPQLVWHGMFIFLLGLLTGFFELHFTNVHSKLSLIRADR